MVEIIHNIPMLPKRPKDSHKGNYGRLLVIGGSRAMSGAGTLASLAALRSGVGAVTYALPESLHEIAASQIKSIMVESLPETKDRSLSLLAEEKIIKLIESHSVLALGPGLSQNSETYSLVRKLIKNIRCPMVIDADGLNAIANHIETILPREDQTILTPHPGEFSLLTGLSVQEISENRQQMAIDFALKYKCILVLKFSESIVTDGTFLYINKSGNPGMSKAGSGDVLTGIIASFLCQGLDPFESAQLGVWYQGRAGDLANQKFGDYGIIAEDIIDHIPFALIE